MKYRVVMMDDSGTPFPPEYTYFYFDSLEEAKEKEKELIKEHTYCEDVHNPWFSFKIEIGEEKTYTMTKMVWKKVK